MCEFLDGASGLTSNLESSGQLEIFQSADGKSLKFHVEDVEEVMSRHDSEGQNFLQVNFVNGQKILLTQRLVGFKPAQFSGLDMDKLPKVVTTPDLVSVVEAIEESMSSDNGHPVEVDVLKKVFDAVLEGGEAVGFNLEGERAWLKRLSPIRSKASL